MHVAGNNSLTLPWLNADAKAPTQMSVHGYTSRYGYASGYKCNGYKWTPMSPFFEVAILTPPGVGVLEG
jgi:hypothetical protein